MNFLERKKPVISLENRLRRDRDILIHPKSQVTYRVEPHFDNSADKKQQIRYRVRHNSKSAGVWQSAKQLEQYKSVINTIHNQLSDCKDEKKLYELKEFARNTLKDENLAKKVEKRHRIVKALNLVDRLEGFLKSDVPNFLSKDISTDLYKTLKKLSNSIPSLYKPINQLDRKISQMECFEKNDFNRNLRNSIKQKPLFNRIFDYLENPDIFLEEVKDKFSEYFNTRSKSNNNGKFVYN